MGKDAPIFPRGSVHGIPVACGSRRCPRANTGRVQVLPQEDAEMKSMRVCRLCRCPLAEARGDRAQGPEPSVDEEPHDDD